MSIREAVRHLHPDAVEGVDFAVRGGRLTQWRVPGARPPTKAELDAAEAAYSASPAGQAAGQLRQAVRTLANSAVGQPVQGLSPAQVRALLAVVLWQAGGLAADGTVRALAEWVKD